MAARMSWSAGMFVAGALGVCGVAKAGPTISSWIGMSGDWTDATNWSTDPVFPNNNGATFAVFIDVDQADYVVTLDQMITITSLDLVGLKMCGPMAAAKSLTVFCRPLARAGQRPAGLGPIRAREVARGPG